MLVGTDAMDWGLVGGVGDGWNKQLFNVLYFTNIHITTKQNRNVWL